MNPRIGIVVLNWNGWRDTIACAASVRQLQYDNCQLYIVDNASTDGSEQHLRQWDAGLSIIQSGANLGWSGGCNVGIRAARAAGCEHVYLLNNDATVRPDTLSHLVEAARLPDAAAVGSLVVSARDQGWAEFAGSVVDSRAGHPRQVHCRVAELDNYDPVPTVAVKGCSMLLTGSALDRIGLLADEYFLNYDETDWCYRASAAGMTNYFAPRSVIEHKGAVAFQGTDGPLYRYFITRNRLLFAHRNLDRQGLRFAWRCAMWELKDVLLLDRQPGGRSLRHRAILAEAVGRAIRDYAGGRFGDCPQRIRNLNRRYATG